SSSSPPGPVVGSAGLCGKATRMGEVVGIGTSPRPIAGRVARLEETASKGSETIDVALCVLNPKPNKARPALTSTGVGTLAMGVAPLLCQFACVQAAHPLEYACRKGSRGTHSAVILLLDYAIAIYL